MHLLQWREIAVQFEPYVPAKLFHLMQYRRGHQFGILEFGDQQRRGEEVLVAAAFPVQKIFSEIGIMQLVDQQFDTFLYFAADGVLPQVLEIGDDASSVTDDTVADGIENFLVGVIDQMKQR